MIQIVKLTDGREVIGDVTDEDGYTVVVRDPFIIHYLWSDSSPVPSATVSRYSLFSVDDEDARIPSNLVLQLLTPRDSIVNFYNLAVLRFKTSISRNIDSMLDEAVFEGSTQLIKEQISIDQAMQERMRTTN